MNTTFELIWLILVNPGKAFKKIREEKPLYAALIFLLMYGIVAVVAGHFAGKNINGALPEMPSSQVPPYLKDFSKTFGTFMNNYLSSTLFFITGLIMPYIVTFVSASIYDLIAQFTVKKANGITLFTAWAFAAMPMVMYKLLYLIIFVTLNYKLPLYVELIFIVWGIYLYIIAIKESYEIDTGIAIGIYFIPFLITFIVLVIYASLLASVIGSILPSLPKGALTP